MNKKSTYIFSADVIRSVAILGVVIIHIVNAIYTRPDFFGGITWFFAITLDSFSRISIPLFIMLSGYLILRKDESFEQALKRILFRILIPLAVWIVFYTWYGGGLPSFLHFHATFLPNIFFSNVYHLYFLVILLGLYFVAPIIRSYLRSVSSASADLLMKILLIGGIAEVGLQFIFRACASENFFTRWVPYTGLFVAGYVLGTKSGKFNSYKLLTIYSLGLLVTIGFNYLHYFLLTHYYNLFDSKGCLSNYIDHYLSVHVVVMSLCAFLLLFHFKYERLKNNIFVSKFVHSVARASFGIYILHPFVARFLEMQFRLAIDFSPLPLLVVIVLRLFLVLTISYLLTIVISKIPLIKLSLGAGK